MHTLSRDKLIQFSNPPIDTQARIKHISRWYKVKLLLKLTQNDGALIRLTFFATSRSYFAHEGIERRNHKTQIRSTSLAVTVTLFSIHHWKRSKRAQLHHGKKIQYVGNSRNVFNKSAWHDAALKSAIQYSKMLFLDLKSLSIIYSPPTTTQAWRSPTWPPCRVSSSRANWHNHYCMK